MARGGTRRKRRRRPLRRVGRLVERAVLGGIMTMAAFVIERRLLKAIRAGGKKEKELAASPQDVRQ